MQDEKKTTEEDIAEGQIIDVEPDQVEKPQSEIDGNDAAKTKSNLFSSLPLPLVLAVLAIFAVSISWVAGYRYWQNMLSDLSNMQDRISATLAQQKQLDEEIKKAKASLQEQKQALKLQVDQSSEQAEQMESDRMAMNRKADAMQLAVDQVNMKMGRSHGQWQIAEAEYLMRIANHRLALSQDINTAITALQQADLKLLESGDPAYYRVRESLANEISLLKATGLPDIAGMAATLQSLSNNVTQLTVAGTSSKVVRNQLEPTASERNLDTLLEDSWKGFKELMVVRRHDQPVSAMLPPSQQYFLYQNLQLQLESARLALLRQENILFSSSLDTAIEWLESFFDQEDATTRNILDSLKNIRSTNLNPSLPDISGSLDMLMRLRADRS